MMKTRLLALALVSVAIALPAFGKTYKNTYPVPCSEVWAAVKDTLGNGDNYEVVKNDDGTMMASYKVKHAAHVNISGAILQRTNKVTLVPNGAVCEMQVVSNYSGWEHNDQNDFRKRVDDALAKTKAAKSSEAAKPAAAPEK